MGSLAINEYTLVNKPIPAIYMHCDYKTDGRNLGLFCNKSSLGICQLLSELHFVGYLYDYDF